ncbi:MAG: LysE family transporter [Acidobacteria bacterium]|nr:LysE family transporter [Acidobacteriota bacterium]
MLTVALTGVVFGLAAGVTPGPLLTLVVTESLRGGVGAGMRVAAAPLLTDGPIVLVSIVLLTRVDGTAVLGALALAGAALLGYLAWDGLTVAAPEAVATPGPRGSALAKGAAVNLLNPHPYIFWLGIGGPTLLGAWDEGAAPAVAFLAAMYGCLVGSKVVVAWGVGKGRRLLQSRGYVYLVRALGLALGVFAVRFARDGLQHLGVL